MQIKKMLVRTAVTVGMSAIALVSTTSVALADTYSDCIAQKIDVNICRQLQNNQSNSNTGTPIQAGVGYAANIGNLINFALTVVMVVALLLVLGFLILGGIQWITSGGEKGKTEEARNKITSAIIGLIVLAASYAILQLVLRFLGFSDLTSAINNVRPINQPQVGP